MSEQRTCLGEDDLIAYLYDECDAPARARVQEHLAGCPGCRAELGDLGRVRQHLVTWLPPEQTLGFRVVAEPPMPARSWAAGAARWLIPAAAVLVLAAAAAVARVEVRYDADGLVVRTGWERPLALEAGPALPAVTPGTAAEAAGGAAAWRPDLASLEQRLRDDLAAQAAGAGGVGEADVLRRVRVLIEESERRQQRELALRMMQLVRDIESQRQVDLVRIEQGLGRLEGMTGAEAAQQRELLNYLVRVSSQR